MMDIYILVCSHTALRNLKCATGTLQLSLLGASPLNRENPHSLCRISWGFLFGCGCRCIHTHTHTHTHKCFQWRFCTSLFSQYNI